MEQLLAALEAYIIEKLPPYLAALTEESVPLVDLTDATVVTGDCDITKYTGPNILFINPDGIKYNDLSISDYERTLALDFLIVCRTATTAVLYKKALRYIAALNQLFVDDLELGGIGAINIISEDYYDGLEGNTAIKGDMLTCEISF